jgi:glycosyltransferase involved in cell wall biosynthesis
VGRLVPVKDHDLFLHAAARLRARPGFRDARFVVVGGGERDAELRRRAVELGLGDCTTFLGWRRDLERIYPDLDCVTLTSRNEGTPVSLIEALVAGRPVVATAVGGVGDVLRGGARGELVASRDPEAFAAGIEGTLRGRDGRAASERRSVAAEFGIARLRRDIEGLYEELLAAPRAG